MRGRRATQRSSSEEEVPSKSTFFSNFFAGSDVGRTETRDDSIDTDGSDRSDRSDGSSDEELQEYPFMRTRHAETSDSNETEAESEADASLEDFDRELRARHAHACKYMRRGKFPKALKHFEGILASILGRYGETHHRVGAALHNVGIANLRAGKLNDAMDAIEEAIRIRKLTLGKGDPKVADSLVELGIVLLSLKEYADSLEIFYEALDLREDEAEDLILPEDIKESNLKIAKVLNNIGCVNYERGEYVKAKKAFDDAIKLQKTALGESPFSFSNPAAKPGLLTLASTLCNRGYVDLEENKFVQAIKTFSESLKVQKSLLDADDKLVLSTLDNLGYAYTMHGKYETARTTYSQLLTNQEQTYGDASKERGATLRKLSYAQLKVRDYDGALKSLCSLEDIQVEIYGDDSPQLEETRRLMGQVNYQVFKYPSLSEASRAFVCFACGDGSNKELDFDAWIPKKPSNGSKMSGHRVAYA